MDQGKAITAIIVGCILIIASFISKNFYGARGVPMAMVSDRRIPTWQGRLLFWVVGGTFILVGTMFFFPNK
jgi:hypothetical protein